MHSLVNWLSQIASLTKFGLMTLPQRRGAVLATLIGVAGVVAVLVGVLSIAANSSSCAVEVSFQPSVMPPSSGFTSTVRSPLSQLRRSSPVEPARWLSIPCESAATVVPARFAMLSKISPVAASPASIPVSPG